MNHTSFFSASAFALAAFLAPVLGAAEPPVGAPPAIEAAEPRSFNEAELLETFGWFVGKRIGLSELGFTPEQVEAIVKGVRQAAAGNDAPFDLDQIGPQMDVFMQTKQTEYMGKVREESEAESKAFLEEAAKRPGVEVLPSGVLYEVIQPGTGDFPKPADTVKVHYTGTLADGSVFDSSFETGQPAEFRVDQVIEGWEEGIQKINKGGKLKLYIPAHLAYGDNPPPGSPIPPAAALGFEIELLDITSADITPADLAPAEVNPAVEGN